jgi:hypothetical protein
MIKRTSILVLFFLLHPSAVVCASSLNETRVNISISNAAGQPLPDLHISMDLYFYEFIAADQLEVRGAFTDECTTDEHGACSILVGETHDLLLRGSLDLGEYGSRNLEWHGGALDVPIRIEPEDPAENRVLEESIRIMIYSAILFVFGTLGMIVQRKRAPG